MSESAARHLFPSIHSTAIPSPARPPFLLTDAVPHREGRRMARACPKSLLAPLSARPRQPVLVTVLDTALGAVDPASARNCGETAGGPMAGGGGPVALRQGRPAPPHLGKIKTPSSGLRGRGGTN